MVTKIRRKNVMQYCCSGRNADACNADADDDADDEDADAVAGPLAVAAAEVALDAVGAGDPKNDWPPPAVGVAAGLALAPDGLSAAATKADALVGCRMAAIRLR